VNYNASFSELVVGRAPLYQLPGQAGQVEGNCFGQLGVDELDKIATEKMTERRRRYNYFDRRLFADPAWEILLTLTIAECRQQRVTISQLCDRIEAPMTTALRWTASMTDDGLLVRREDPTDRRRKFIQLAPEAFFQMVQYFSAGLTHPLGA
jgi:DNA-binding MarR family transcriptional regulator